MPEVQFIQRTDKTVPGFHIGIVCNNKPTKGDVGIEIELEGKNLLHEEDTPSPWKYVVDHSLRGEENAEYVLAKPLAFDKVEKALDVLWKGFEDKKATFDKSNRTSVHVHLNFQNFHFNRLASFMGLYYAVEEALVEWCGEYRVGNLFCLRAVDAPAIITYMKRFIRTDGNSQIHDMLRYAGLNPNALIKYGSMEVRTLRGCSDKETILNWVQILQRIYELSAEFPDPREVPAMFSSGGPFSFFSKILGDKAQLVRDGINWTDEQLKNAMFRGIRFAQDICYCRDWDRFQTMDVQPDPFGRDSRKIAKKLVAQASPAAAATGALGVAPMTLDELQQQIYANESLDDYDY